MPSDDRRAAWLTGLRAKDAAVHRTLTNESAALEARALSGRLASLQAELLAMRGALRVRDEIIHDLGLAIAERDMRIDVLGRQLPKEGEVSSHDDHQNRVLSRVGNAARSTMMRGRQMLARARLHVLP